MEIYFKLRAHDYRMLQSAVIVYKRYANQFDFGIKGPIYLKKKKKTLVLLRSPHVNKKSREIFKFVTHSCLIVLKKEKLTEKELDFFIKTTGILNYPGVSTRMVRKF